jgi:hypothetical protein
LLVVTHDRYLMERVTDQQYAIIDGRLQMLPGGVEEYLRTVRLPSGGATSVLQPPAPPISGPATISADRTAAPGSGSPAAQLRAARKELASVERRLAKLRDQLACVHGRLAEHDQSDYLGLADLSHQASDLQSEIDSTEERWLVLAESVN